MNNCYYKILVFLFPEISQKKLKIRHKRSNLISISQKKSIKKGWNKRKMLLVTISKILKRLKNQSNKIIAMTFNQINVNIGIVQATLMKLVIASRQLSNKMKKMKIKYKQ
jgi:hypothetical protein